MDFLFQTDSGSAAAPQQRHDHQARRRTGNPLLRRQCARTAYVGLSICILLSTSSPSAPQDANAGAQETVRYFGVGAAPVEATAPTQASLPAGRNSGTTASNEDTSGRQGDTPGSGEDHSPSTPALLGIVHMGTDADGLAGRSSVTTGGEAALAGGRQATAKKTELPDRMDVSQDSRTTHRGIKLTYVQQVEEPALLEEHTAHGERAKTSGLEECSCELAGHCLAKGPCVAIACGLVTLSLIGVFLLAWLLQWLSAIPSEWILAKRLRRRPLGFPSKDESRRPKDGSGSVKMGAQQVQHPPQGGGPDNVPLLQEQQTAAADSLGEETSVPEAYDAFATPVPKTENGRL